MDPEAAEPPVQRSARAALLDAARRLAGELPARPFGVREIARAAGVNHSLVYRYFGSLEALLDEATRDRDAMTLRLLDDPGVDEIVTAVFDLVVDQPFVAARLAEACIASRPEGWAQQSYLVRRVRERVAELHPEMDDAGVDMRTTSLVTAALGYVLYEPFLVASLEVPDVAIAGLRAAHRAVLGSLLREPPERSDPDED